MFLLNDYNLNGSVGGPLALSLSTLLCRALCRFEENEFRQGTQGVMKLVGTCRNQLTDMDQFITF